MKATLDRPHLISLAAGFTDNPTLPLLETRKVVRHVLHDRRRGQAALQYGTTAGDPELLGLSAQWLDKMDAGTSVRFCSPGRMIITSGSQQFLYLVTECLCDPGDIVLVEDPTYFVYLGLAQSHGLRCFGVTLQPDGLDIEHLDGTLAHLKRTGELHRVKFLYLVSYFQNPSGVTTSAEKKSAALEVLLRYERDAGHPIYLLEDAAYRPLRFSGGEIPSALCARHGASRVIYTATFSKPFATGIRIGFGCLPPDLRDAVVRVKGNHDFGSANFLQQLLAEALRSGGFERHLALLRSRYRRKAETMRAALLEHFPKAVEWTMPAGGLYFWARVPQWLGTGIESRLYRRALEKDVLYVPGAMCYADDPRRSKPDHELRLSFGNASEDEIREGIQRLGEALGELLEQ